VQQGSDDFVKAFQSSKALHKSAYKFHINPKNRDGSADTLLFPNQSWEGGKIFPTYFPNPFQLKKRATPWVKK
jgi:hypothetical protein